MSHRLVLVVHRDPVPDQSADDLQVALGRGALQSGVPGLEKKRGN